MKTKPKTPYQHLLEDIQKFCKQIQFRHRKTMWTYPKAQLGSGWNLKELWARTAAAEQLGYDVELIANDTGLIVRYVKKVPDVPYDWQ